MSTFNIRQLEDTARDVDPDLRYMALQDFQKVLNNPKIQARNVTAFVPILFALLHDPTTEVQNQAVKSFAPLVRHISDQETAQTMERLYDEVEKAPATSKFTTSVPNMAMRCVFVDAHTRFGKPLARQVVDLLLPRLLAPQLAMSIDKIEILIDLVKALGGALLADELAYMAAALVAVAAKESGIISKRAIVAVDAALAYVPAATLQPDRQAQFYDKLVDDIVGACATSAVFFTLLQVVLALARKAAAPVLSDKTTHTVFLAIVQKLALDSLASDVDVEDLDIDVLTQANSLREDACITLAALIPCVPRDALLHTYAATIFHIVRQLVAYDPLLYHASDDDIDFDDESEVEFSDDDQIEQFEDAGDNDGLAAKLRLLALVALRQLLAFPKLLPLIYAEGLPDLVFKALGDRSDLVSNEAIAATVELIAVTCASGARSRANSDTSMTTEAPSRSPYVTLSEKYASELENQVFNNLLTAKNILRFTNTKLLLEALIVGLPASLSDQFLPRLLDSLAAFKLTLKVYPEIVKLYKVILSSYEFEALPPQLLDYIFADLTGALNDTGLYHSFISDILSVCKIIFKKVSGNDNYTGLMNSTFFPVISSKVNMRQYSSDIRQHFLSALTELIVNVEITLENLASAIEIFQESLNYEVTVNFTIENLINVCEKKPQLFHSNELCNLIVDKLNSYLGSSDTTLYVHSLTLLDCLFSKPGYEGNAEELKILSENIFDLLQETSDPILTNKAFHVLGHIVKFTGADNVYLERLLQSVVNTKLADVEDLNFNPLKYLISQILLHNKTEGRELYEAALSNLILRNFISAKIMALITTQCKLTSEVSVIEEELFAASQNPGAISVDRMVFDIQFLGCVSSEVELSRFSFEEFYSILNNNTNENCRLAASRAMGLCITRDPQRYLPTLLDSYQLSSSENDHKKNLILIAIKQVLKEEFTQTEIASFRSIWDRIVLTISEKQGSLTHKDVSELKLAGDILSRIAELDTEGDYQAKTMSLLREQQQENCNEFLIYTLVVVIKQLMSSNAKDFDVQIVENMIVYLPILNLELKLAIVSTLLTGLYNKSITFAFILNSVVLPRIYDELGAKEEFKKVIPMGPYKYVVDEGLEVRKLSYELISAMINVDNDKIQAEEVNIDQVKMFEVLLTKGLNDTENDIINLTVLNLMQLIDNDENVLKKISNQHDLIASLTKIINRKLRSKASTQESESYEDTLRSVIKLSKAINTLLINSNSLSSEWSTYYHELKNKHHLLFSAVSA